MVEVTTRRVKGSPLTHDEIDDNFDGLAAGVNDSSLSFSLSDGATAGEDIVTLLPVHPFRIEEDFGDARAKCDTDGNLVFSKNGVVFGSITFSDGGSSQSFNGDETDFASGDEFTIATEDAFDFGVLALTIPIIKL